MFVSFTEIYGDRRGGYRILVRKPDKERRLGKNKCRGKSTLKMGLPKCGMGRHGLDSSGAE
jgi:hypothetical protein